MSYPIPASNGRTETVRSEMVERVARALAVTRSDAGAAAESEFKGGNLWCEARRDAIVAIEAMLEPTAEMVAAGERAQDDDWYRGDSLGWKQIPRTFSAMIQAALPDPQAREREEGA